MKVTTNRLVKSGMAVAGVAVAAVFVVVPLGTRANSDNMAFGDQESPSPPADNEKLVAHLKSHWKSPEDYVVSKFSDHDIVFIGEYHRIKHDVELIHSLIPRLYKAGVYNLGIEFGCYEHQDKVDRLITADRYDEEMARWLMFQQNVAWGFKEYQDIYRKAWELNKSLPKGAHRFRVVNLGYKADWSALKEQTTDEDRKKVWTQGDPDEHMAQVVLKEFVDKGQKALIYSGANHAFTHYHQPGNDRRMGNLVYAKIPDRVFNIYLHAPWGPRVRSQVSIRPVGGVIDAVMSELGNGRVGFEVKGSPFGDLPDTESYYSISYPNFTLAAYCDGYIFQKRLEDYEGVTVDPVFITEANFQEAISNFPNFNSRKFIKKPADFIEGMREEADFKQRFRNLK